MIRPIRTFTVSPSLPPELERQRALVYNLRWAWNHDAIELFRWDRDLWEQSGHNPALMLGTIDQATLQAAASDEGFLAHLNRVSNDFDAYQKIESTWFRKHHDGTNNLLVAYFSQVGRVALYLLDTNIKQNSPPDQDITDQLYGGDAEMRLKQEMMLGVGGCRALEALGIRPNVYHLNEGHSAFLALELIHPGSQSLRAGGLRGETPRPREPREYGDSATGAQYKSQIGARRRSHSRRRHGHRAVVRRAFDARGRAYGRSLGRLSALPRQVV